MGKAKRKITADEALAALDSKHDRPAPPDDVLAFIRGVAERNDDRPTNRRLGMAKVRALLVEHYGVNYSDVRMEQICVKYLGRQGWARA